MPSVDPKYNKYTLIKNPFAKSDEPKDPEDSEDKETE